MPTDTATPASLEIKVCFDDTDDTDTDTDTDTYLSH